MSYDAICLSFSFIILSWQPMYWSDIISMNKFVWNIVRQIECWWSIRDKVLQFLYWLGSNRFPKVGKIYFFDFFGGNLEVLYFIYLHLLHQQQNATNITNISCRIPGWWTSSGHSSSKFLDHPPPEVQQSSPGPHIQPPAPIWLHLDLWHAYCNQLFFEYLSHSLLTLLTPSIISNIIIPQN